MKTNFRPSWWNVTIMVASPLLILYGQLKNVDPAVVQGTIAFLDQTIWQIAGGVWGILGEALITVRILIEGWRRVKSEKGDTIGATTLQLVKSTVFKQAA